MSGQEELGKRGPEWDAPIERLFELGMKFEGGQINHPDLRLLRLQTQAMAAIREYEGRSGIWSEKEVMDHAPGPLLDAGLMVLKAWMNGDVEFFRELARVAEIITGQRRLEPDRTPNECVVIDTAFELASTGINPTREQVVEAVKQKGVIIMDWTKTWKNCRLGFLKREHRGRPKGRTQVKR